MNFMCIMWCIFADFVHNFKAKVSVLVNQWKWKISLMENHLFINFNPNGLILARYTELKYKLRKLQKEFGFWRSVPTVMLSHHYHRSFSPVTIAFKDFARRCWLFSVRSSDNSFYHWSHHNFSTFAFYPPTRVKDSYTLYPVLFSLQ